MVLWWDGREGGDGGDGRVVVLMLGVWNLGVIKERGDLG